MARQDDVRERHFLIGFE